MAVKPFSYIKDKKRGDYYQVKDPDATRNIGDLTTLLTTAKNNLVAAINEIVGQGGGGGASPYDQNPASLGTASPGSSNNYARGDHVHQKPSAADLGITVPEAATATPADLGTKAVGTSTKYAREDHVHKLPFIPTAGSSNPEPLGTASPGSSLYYAHSDHVHAMPTAANVGAIAAPSSPTVGDFLVYTSNGWAAQSLSTWQGGSY